MGKVARNEKRKLTATLLNAGGITVLTSSILTPAIQMVMHRHEWVAYAAALLMAVVLHMLARKVLSTIEE